MPKRVRKSRKVKRAGRASAPRRAPKGTFKVVVRYRPHKKKTFDKGKGKPPKYIRLLVAKARRYKKGKAFTSAESRAFNKRLADEMAKAGYTPDAIREAKYFRISSKIGLEAWSRVTAKVERKSFKRVKGRDVLKSVRIDGKWISAARFKAKIRTTKYWAQVNAYRDRYGLTVKEARELWKGLRDEQWGQKVFQAFY